MVARALRLGSGDNVTALVVEFAAARLCFSGKRSLSSCCACPLLALLQGADLACDVTRYVLFQPSAWHDEAVFRRFFGRWYLSTCLFRSTLDPGPGEGLRVDAKVWCSFRLGCTTLIRSPGT